jgi:hypothetical protein
MEQPRISPKEAKRNKFLNLFSLLQVSMKQIEQNYRHEYKQSIAQLRGYEIEEKFTEVGR